MRRMCIFKTHYGRRGGSSVFFFESIDETEDLEQEDEEVYVKVYTEKGDLVGDRIPITEIEPVTKSMLDYTNGVGRYVPTLYGAGEMRSYVSNRA